MSFVLKTAMADNPQPIALIMAGGSGTRFWPASTQQKPKQYLSLWGDESLIQMTAKRVEPLVPSSHLYICSTESQRRWLEEQLPEVAHPGWLVLEPTGRNTAPCLMLSTLTLKKAGYSDDTAMVVLPADHHIANETAFQKLLREAFALAVQTNGLITFGITPTSAHTGYGYIEAGKPLPSSQARTIQRFVEKPDAATAETYYRSGNFFWNSGIFVWTLGSISNAFQRFMPNEWKLLEQSLSQPATAYAKLPSIAIDVAVMEKSDNGFVLPAPDLGWSDVGSWNALYELRQEQNPTDNVVLSGKVTSLESSGCLVKARSSRQIALVGVEDLVIVEEGDRLLILKRSKDQLVKKLSERDSE